MTKVVAMPAPSAKVSPSARAGVITSPSVSTASAATDRSIQLCDAIAKRLRSTMSAIDPMTSASSTAGTLFAVWTRAISVGESDSAAITVTAPTVFIQITSWEPARAVHAARKPGRRSGASAESSGDVVSSGCKRVHNLVDGDLERQTRRGRDTAGRRARGGGPPGHGVQGAQRGDSGARERGDGQARAQGGRRARLPAQPDRPGPEDQPLVHHRRADPGSHEPALPADPAGHRGPARDGRLYPPEPQHAQRPRARAARLPDDSGPAGGRDHRRHRAPRPPPARRAARGGRTSCDREPAAGWA